MSRFREPQHPDFHRLNASLEFDRRLWPYDVEQSRAHAAMLAARDIISGEDRDTLLGGLSAVEAELAGGTFAFAEGDEDVHMAVERRLTELVGGRRQAAHGRTRNDQVVTDVGLYLRRAIERQDAALGALQRRCSRGPRTTWTPSPGLHASAARPAVTSGHHLLAYFWMLGRDRAPLRVPPARPVALPLGAGAPAGLSYDPDRAGSPGELGFERPPTTRSMRWRAATSRSTTCRPPRSSAAMSAASAPRWSSGPPPSSASAAAGRLERRLSIMPQKRNPDAAELMRAAAPRLSHLGGVLGVLHGLPLAYNNDLREDKRYLFDAVDSLDAVPGCARLP